MIPKSGQVTVFIIFSILLVVSLFIFFSYTDVPNSFTKGSNIDFYFKDCVYSSSFEGVKEIALNGGYYLEGNISLAIYINSSGVFLPSYKDVQDSHSKYVEKNLLVCLNKSLDFEKYGLSIDEISVNSSIFPNFIIINSSISLYSSTSDNNYLFEEYNNVNLSIPLGNIIDVSKKIISENSLKTNYSCLTCIEQLGSQYNLNISFIDTGAKDIYLISYLFENQSVDWFFGRTF